MTRISDLITTSTISDTGVFVVVDQNVTKKLSWLDFKTSGLKGDKGDTGNTGTTGATGPMGTTTQIQVGTVSLSTSSEVATVIATTSTITSSITILDFVVAPGPKGDTGTFVPVVATTDSIGGVKIGDGIDIDLDGTISLSTLTQYQLLPASVFELGGVIIGDGVEVDEDGVISVNTGTPYVLATATTTVLGGVKIGAGVNITNGVISVTTGAFALQTATNAILGGIKIGGRLSASLDGTVSVNIASTSSTGTVRIGTGIDVTANGTISVNSQYLSAAALTGTTLSSSVTASSLTSLGNLSGLTVQGTSSIQQTLESYTDIIGAIGTVEHDCSQGVIFVHTSAVANWTANFTNVPTTPNKTSSVALLINQQATPYVPQFVQINGVSQIIRWQGGVAPTGNAGKRDLVNFTFISQNSTATTFTVLGSLSSFG
jgi:hypothetical protein